MESRWIGWPGAEVKRSADRESVRHKLNKQNCVPVFLAHKVCDPLSEQKRQEREREMSVLCVTSALTGWLTDRFHVAWWSNSYNGFCNNVLWPLFHYLPREYTFDSLGAVHPLLTLPSQCSNVISLVYVFALSLVPVESIASADSQFDAYKLANQSFADVVIRTYHDGDVVWIHDYHLMLLPTILRRRFPNIKIGFFFHTPFPAFEIYRVLPARTELLMGVLNADLIGFHTPDYQRHFQDCCVRILPQATAEGDSVTFDGFTAKLGSFPIGIDPQRFITSVETAQTREYMEQYRRDFHGKKVLLGIDRLDYIKGIQHKIYALERLFQKHPEMAKEVVLVQIAVPSRTDVVEYQRLKAATHKLVGRVNGLYGSVGNSPLFYLDQSIPFDRMCALYRVADAMVITSVRDGMNLVAYEFIACQKDMAGSLILSEFAGAAQSLGDAPLTVNPWSINSVSDAMYTALTMPESERRARNADMFQAVTTQTSSVWARQFLTATLQSTSTPLNWLKEITLDAESHDDTATNEDLDHDTDQREHREAPTPKHAAKTMQENKKLTEAPTPSHGTTPIASNGQ